MKIPNEDEGRPISAFFLGSGNIWRSIWFCFVYKKVLGPLGGDRKIKKLVSKSKEHGFSFTLHMCYYQIWTPNLSWLFVF